MNKFEGIFDEVKEKAKSMYGVASKATNEVMDMGKVRYQIKQIQWEIEKTYAKLGSVVYEQRKGGTDLEDVVNLSIAEVDSLNEKLEELEKRLRSYRKAGKCTGCGKENEPDSSFCCRCGKELEKFECDAQCCGEENCEHTE